MLPPAREIDDRIIGGGENIAGRDDIGAAEENNAVAVGVSIGQVDDLDALAIEATASSVAR